MLLFPLSLVFGAVVRLRRTAFALGIARRERLPVPVIVVGNFTVGGTGKTPLVLWLLRCLRAEGYRPGVISRGYGGDASGVRAVPVPADPATFGDEPSLLAIRSGVPVWIGRDRVAAAHGLLAANPTVNVIVCDDGLQHLRLARDIEIAVSDARGNGNGWLMPAGPLREPPRAVDARVRNGVAPSPGELAMRLQPQRLYPLHDPSSSVEVMALAGKRVHAVAGIGSPARFFAQLADMGIRATAHPFPDHHRFIAADLAFEACDWIVMTEKDAVKCTSFSRRDLLALQVEAALDPALATLVLEKLRGRSPA